MRYPTKRACVSSIPLGTGAPAYGDRLVFGALRNGREERRPRTVSASLIGAREIAERESGLAVVITYRADGSAHASVVNAGIVNHPVSGEPAIGFVVQGRERKKLVNLRARPSSTVVFRSGWDWVAIEGNVDLAGPDDRLGGLTPDAVSRLFHEIYAAAIGGSPQDWAGSDDVIDKEGHTAVLLRPTRVYSNPNPD